MSIVPKHGPIPGRKHSRRNPTRASGLIAKAALEADRRWFAEHPGVRQRLREYVLGEFGPPAFPICQIMVLVEWQRSLFGIICRRVVPRPPTRPMHNEL
jgi:hypothetical protein